VRGKDQKKPFMIHEWFLKGCFFLQTIEKQRELI